MPHSNRQRGADKDQTDHRGCAPEPERLPTQGPRAWESAFLVGPQEPRSESHCGPESSAWVQLVKTKKSTTVLAKQPQIQEEKCGRICSPKNITEGILQASVNPDAHGEYHF